MFNFSKQKHINFKVLHDRADRLLKQIPAVRERRKLSARRAALNYFFYGLVSLLLILVALTLIRLISLKDAYQQAVLGKFNLEQSMIFAKQEDFSRAASLALAGADNFAGAFLE